MKLIKRFKNRFRRWNAWRKLTLNSRTHQIRVLLGLTHSPTFEFFLLPDEYPNVKNMYHGVDMVNNEAFESAKGLSASLIVSDKCANELIAALSVTEGEKLWIELKN